jgi:glyoxylate/hydroxypyruvate/2-ketogluconate reductase
MQSVSITRRIFDDQLTALSAAFSVRSNQPDGLLAAPALAAHLQTAEGALVCVTERIDAALLDACLKLKIISQIAVGINNIDLAACTARGIMVTNTPGVLTETTADTAWALLMATARKIPASEQWLRQGAWTHWALDQWLGKDVHGATLGIVGMGRIGSAIARRALGFGMQINYFNRSPASNQAEFGATRLELNTLLAQSDFVVLVVPYSEATHHLIGARELALMKPDAILINIARGGVVDDAALIDALQAKRIGGAGLDVFENEPQFDQRFLQLENAVLTPHIGSASLATRRAMSQLAIDNLRAGLAGQMPPNLVNPQVLKGQG